MADPTLPDIDVDLVKALEDLYPPRCYEGEERVEDHLMYAGKVQLVADLRIAHDRQVAEALSPDDFDYDGGA